MRKIAASKMMLGLTALGIAAAPVAAEAASRMRPASDADMQHGRMQAQADGMERGDKAGGVRTGTLECDVSAGAGFVIGSKRDVACTYKAAGMKPQRYVGSINRIGLDVGVTSKSVMVWQVVAPTTEAKRQGLDGQYRGVSASAAAAYGANANVLVASNTGFNLQPVNVGGQRGINLAAGVGSLNLRSADRG